MLVHWRWVGEALGMGCSLWGSRRLGWVLGAGDPAGGAWAGWVAAVATREDRGQGPRAQGPVGGLERGCREGGGCGWGGGAGGGAGRRPCVPRRQEVASAECCTREVTASLLVLTNTFRGRVPNRAAFAQRRGGGGKRGLAREARGRCLFPASDSSGALHRLLGSSTCYTVRRPLGLDLGALVRPPRDLSLGCGLSTGANGSPVECPPQVSAFSTWEKELHKIVFDPRYLLLNSEERKQVRGGACGRPGDARE